MNCWVETIDVLDNIIPEKMLDLMFIWCAAGHRYRWVCAGEAAQGCQAWLVLDGVPQGSKGLHGVIVITLLVLHGYSNYSFSIAWLYLSGQRLLCNIFDWQSNDFYIFNFLNIIRTFATILLDNSSIDHFILFFVKCLS